MPDPYHARESIWVPFMRETLKCDASTIIVGAYTCLRGWVSASASINRVVAYKDAPLAFCLIVAHHHHYW